MGFPVSQAFHGHKGFRIAEAIPGVATVSALVRLISAVALAVANVFKACFGKSAGGTIVVPIQENEKEACIPETLDDYRQEAYKALGYNVMMIGDALITAIPIIGNIQSWHWAYMSRKASQYDYV